MRKFSVGNFIKAILSDPVYSIKDYSIEKCKVVSIEIRSIESSIIWLMNEDYETFSVYSKDFGRTVFLTREEADVARNKYLSEKVVVRFNEST